MNKHKIKKITKIGGAPSTLILAIALLTSVPMTVNADEIDTSIIENYEENNVETPVVVAETPAIVREAPTTTSTPIETEKVDVTETEDKIEYNYSYENNYDTYEEAEKAKDEKEATLDNEGYNNIESTITENTTYENDSFTGTYETEKDAQEALEDYAENVDGNITNSTITENKTKAEETVIEEGNKWLTSKEQADAFVDELEGKVEELNKNGEYTLETETKENVGYMYVDQFGSPEEINETFDSLEEAEEYVNSLKVNKKTQVNVSIVTGTSTGIETKTVEKTFSSLLEARTYIEELESQGYDVSNLKVELSQFEETIWKDEEHVEVNPGEVDGQTFNYGHFDVTLVTEFTKIDEEGNETKVTGNLTVDTVKINNKNIQMEGPNTDPNRGDTEYNSKERNKLSVTNKSLVEITGKVNYGNTTLPYSVMGYLSETQNVCEGIGNAKGFDLEYASVKIINGKVYIDSNIISQYNVSGEITKNISTPTFTVTGEVIPWSQGKMEIKTYTTSYKIKEQTYNYSYTVNANIEIPNTTYDLNVTAKKEIVKEKPATPENPDKPVTPDKPTEPSMPNIEIEDNNVELPKTGDESHIREALATMGLSAMGLISLGYYDLKQKDKVKSLTKKR